MSRSKTETMQPYLYMDRWIGDRVVSKSPFAPSLFFANTSLAGRSRNADSLAMLEAVAEAVQNPTEEFFVKSKVDRVISQIGTNGTFRKAKP